MTVVFWDEAELELREAIDWYNEQEPSVGTRFEKAIDEVLGIISKDPERFPRASRLTRKARVFRWPHSIYFTVDSAGQRIIVVAIFHGKRDPRFLRKRLAQASGRLHR